MEHLKTISSSSLTASFLQMSINISLHHAHSLLINADAGSGLLDKAPLVPSERSSSVAPTFVKLGVIRHFAQTSIPTRVPSFVPNGELKWTPIVIIWILTVVTIIGNLLAIAAFLRNEKIRSKVANHFIFNLSVADLLVGMVSLPVNNTHLHFGYWPFGEVGCKVWLILDYTICFQGMTAVVFISIDRYCWVKWPLKYIRLMTRRRAIGTIMIAWCSGFAFYIIHVLCWEHFEGTALVNYQLHCDLEVIGGLTHAILAVLLEFMLPLVTVATVNGIVYHIVRKRFGGNNNLRRAHSSQKLNYHVQMVNSNSSPASTDVTLNTEKEKRKKSTTVINLPQITSPVIKLQAVPRHWKTAATLSLMVMTIYVLWLPYQVVLLLAPICDDCVSNLLWESVNYLLWATAAVNPFIYAYTNVHYRKEMLKIICFFCRWKCYLTIVASLPDSSRSKSPPNINEQL
ncbi:histamine H3 receptor-like [Amphiura filiformis]|uniref:histamine H3 receptor-like n=1 Tax=Amphiura filiformis TaxID=82378 RepID=UPI003B226C11